MPWSFSLRTSNWPRAVTLKIFGPQTGAPVADVVNLIGVVKVDGAIGVLVAVGAFGALAAVGVQGGIAVHTVARAVNVVGSAVVGLAVVGRMVICSTCVGFVVIVESAGRR